MYVSTVEIILLLQWVGPGCEVIITTWKPPAENMTGKYLVIQIINKHW